MKVDEIKSVALSGREWAIIMAGLGKLPGEVMYSLAKKLEDALADDPEPPPPPTPLAT